MQRPVLNVVSPAPREIWAGLLASGRMATPYQTPAWLDAVCSVGSYADASRLYELSGGRQFVLPMVRRMSRPQRLAIEESMPGAWGTGGLVSAAPVAAGDVTAVWADLDACPAARFRIRPDYLNAGPWDAAERPSGVNVIINVKHVLDLDGGFRRVWQDRFKNSVRNAVRKAERSGLTVECDSSVQLMADYYLLYLNWHARRARERGMPAALMRWRASRLEPFKKFQVVAELLGDACRVWLARLDGQPVAALITLIHGTYALAWRSYSDRELAGPVRANTLLQRLAIEDACRAGCRYYDLGWSDDVASLMAFKNRLGARPQRFPVYTLDRLPFARVEDWQRHTKKAMKQLLARDGRQDLPNLS